MLLLLFACHSREISAAPAKALSFEIEIWRWISPFAFTRRAQKVLFSAYDSRVPNPDRPDARYRLSSRNRLAPPNSIVVYTMCWVYPLTYRCANALLPSPHSFGLSRHWPMPAPAAADTKENGSRRFFIYSSARSFSVGAWTLVVIGWNGATTGGIIWSADDCEVDCAGALTAPSNSRTGKFHALPI